MEPLQSGHLRVLENLAVIERCPLLGGNFKKIVTFGTQYFVRYSWHVRYWEVLLYYGNLKKLDNFYSPLNHQKTYGFPMISGGIEEAN